MSAEENKQPSDYNVQEARESLAVNLGSIIIVVVLLLFVVGRIKQNHIKKELFDRTVPTALLEHRAKEDAALNAYAQLDSAKGVYQIPIEEAMVALVAHPGNIVKVPTDLVIEPPPDPDKDPAAYGKYVFLRQGNARCIVCHNIAPGGEKKMGPDLYGRFGKEVVLANGDKLNFDEAYIRQSIVDPASQISNGFPPVMPGTIVELNSLSEKDINCLIEFIKSN